MRSAASTESEPTERVISIEALKGVGSNSPVTSKAPTLKPTSAAPTLKPTSAAPGIVIGATSVAVGGIQGPAGPPGPTGATGPVGPMG